MYYATATDECPLPFSPFKSCTVPRLSERGAGSEF